MGQGPKQTLPQRCAGGNNQVQRRSRPLVGETQIQTTTRRPLTPAVWQQSEKGQQPALVRRAPREQAWLFLKRFNRAVWFLSQAHAQEKEKHIPTKPAHEGSQQPQRETTSAHQRQVDGQTGPRGWRRVEAEKDQV